MLEKIPTGCDSIDKMLGGGIPSDSVTLVYGEPETGKTTLVVQCAANCARQGYKTLLVDCDGTFHVRRLSQIASKQFKEIGELIILARPESFQQQTTIVDRLPEYVTKGFGLLIVDTVTSLYRLQVAESPNKTFELNRELNRQIALLAQTAKTQRIAVLLASQVQTVFNDANISIEPVATRVLKFWAETIIKLRPTQNPSIIQATMEKDPAKKTHSVTCLMRIQETGIHEYQTP